MLLGLVGLIIGLAIGFSIGFAIGLATTTPSEELFIKPGSWGG